MSVVNTDCSWRTWSIRQDTIEGNQYHSVVFGDYKWEGVIIIQSGSYIYLDELLIFEATRHGKTVWEIKVLLSFSSHVYIPIMLTGCFTTSWTRLEVSLVVSGQGETRWLFGACNTLWSLKVLLEYGGVERGDWLHPKRV